jgi:regulation of enolase protein 1 (concanavalin A-like superfamily)
MPNEVVGKVGVRDRMKTYAEECQRKKDIENREKFEVQKLDDSMADITRFDSPSRNVKYLAPENIGKVESPGVFQFSPEVDPLEYAKKMREKKAHMKTLKPGMMHGTAFDDDDVAVSKPTHSLRPDMMRGRSFDDDDPPRKSSPPRINSMRPGTMRGSSFADDADVPEKPQKVKDAEEEKAKGDLVEHLDQDSKKGKGATVYLKSFSSLRNRYTSSIDTLRPASKPFLVQTKVERKSEAEKVKKYDTLKNAWETYENTAQDKPDPENLTPEEEAAEAKVVEVETAVNKDWQEYAAEAVKVVQDNDDSDDDSEGDDEWDFWILEAKRLKAEAERKKAEEEDKKKNKEKKRRRKEKEEQRKRLEAEDGDIVEIAKRLKEEARKKKEEEKKEKKGSDDASGSKAKNGGKAGKSKSKGDGDESDDDVATGGKAANSGKPGQGKKGRFDSDSDDSDSDDATGDKAKKKPVSKKKGDNDDDPSTPPVKKNKGKVELTEDVLPSPKTPRNQDGTLWKNPLNRWTNKPKKKIKEVNSQIIFKVPEKTDCWRKTRHNFIMDNAPFNWHKVTGDFEAIVKVSGDFGRMYDKAGIMVREDAENWILTGMEFFNKRVNHSTCVTRDFTDWSLSPLPEGAEKHGIWFCIKRVGNSYETFYSLDSKRWIQTRQGLFSDKAILKVGICCACPMGDEFKVTFEGYRVKRI